MSVDPPVVRATDSVRHAVAVLAPGTVRPLLVLDDRDALAGVLTEADLMRAESGDLPCGELVVVPPQALPGDTPLLDALHRRRGCRDEVIVVVEEQRPVGTVGDLDIARVAIRLLPPHEQVRLLPLRTRFVTVEASMAPARALDRLEHERGDLLLVERWGVAVGVLERETITWAARTGVEEVGRICRQTCLYATPDTALRRVAHDMIRSRILALPVRNAGTGTCAVVTLDDIAARTCALLEDPPFRAVA